MLASERHSRYNPPGENNAYVMEDGELVLHNEPLGSEPHPEQSSESLAKEPGPIPVPDPPLDFTQPASGRSAFYRYLISRLRIAAPSLTHNPAQWGLIEPGSESSRYWIFGI